ncbi:MAG: large conductance mechanosensitive channel protein MscL [Sphingomonadaceae bacterium]|nr:large conductance mechanosensitive channel protein MscL [Sphingomonadaceae bacterium]
MLSEFRAFVLRGNVLDLAVAVIIGAAFGAIVTSLTEDVIMPVIGSVLGGLDFSSYFVRLGPIPAGFKGDPGSYADLKKAGVAMLGWGAFLSAVVRFLVLAFVIFWLVRVANRIVGSALTPDPVPAEPTPTETLLAEIRDELRARRP